MSFDRIRFTPGLTDEVRASIEPHLKRWAFLIPAWCREVNICWDDEDSNGALNITVHYEYRRADLMICPNFLTVNAERRERNVIHELLHIITAPMDNTAKDLRSSIVKLAPDVRTWADEMIRHSSESVTCDLEFLVHQRLGAKR